MYFIDVTSKPLGTSSEKVLRFPTIHGNLMPQIKTFFTGMCHLLYLNNLAELQDLSYTEVNLPFLVKVWEKKQKQKHSFLRKIILVALLVTNSPYIQGHADIVYSTLMVKESAGLCVKKPQCIWRRKTMYSKTRCVLADCRTILFNICEKQSIFYWVHFTSWGGHGPVR